MTAPSRKFIETRLVRLDGDTQPREQIDEATVADYAEAMRHGASFPPVTVFNDGSACWLADGFHRFHATRAAGLPTILIDEYSGTRRDAMLFSFSANATHGLRETRADKRRKVEVMLRDDKWVKWSDREIARKCGVSDKTVGALRSELVASAEIPHITARTVERGGTVYHQAARAADADPIAAEDTPPVTDDEPATVPLVETEPAPSPKAEAIEARAPAAKAPTAAPPAHSPDESRLYQEGSSLSAFVLAARAVHAIGQISKKDPNAPTAIEDIRAALERPRAAIGMPVPTDAEVERLRAENAELREQLAELASNLEEAVAEIEVLHRVTKADDQIKAALTEASRVNEHNRVLEERIRGLAGENVEAIRLVKSWKRKAEAAEKLLKAKG